MADATIFYPATSGLRSPGSALLGGTVTFYEPGTTTKRAIYLNPGKTTPAANPYTLDSLGQAPIYTDGSYDVIVKDSTGATISTFLAYDGVNVSSDAWIPITYIDTSDTLAADSDVKVPSQKAVKTAIAAAALAPVVSTSQADAEAGLINIGYMTSLRVAQAIAVQVKIIRSARTSNTILASSDRAKLIDITSGTFSQTLTAAATLGDGWWCWIKNSGTGVVTLDPNGAETVNGAATLVFPSGTSTVLQCTGTAFFTTSALTIGTHEVTVTTGNGYGSTNTAIRRYTTAVTNVGTAITYADSAANGASFTINETGIYAIYTTESSNTINKHFGASLNSAALTTWIAGVAECILIQNVATGWLIYSGSRTVQLTAGDVVRPHHDLSTQFIESAAALFSVKKVAI